MTVKREIFRSEIARDWGDVKLKGAKEKKK
jgi:hypothetical protein